MTDYRQLLKKYMDMVGEVEGTVFSSSWSYYFTPEEVAELEKIDKELLNADQAN